MNHGAVSVRQANCQGTDSLKNIPIKQKDKSKKNPPKGSITHAGGKINGQNLFLRSYPELSSL